MGVRKVLRTRTVVKCFSAVLQKFEECFTQWLHAGKALVLVQDVVLVGVLSTPRCMRIAFVQFWASISVTRGSTGLDFPIVAEAGGDVTGQPR